LKNKTDHIFGIRACIEAIKTGKQFDKLFIKTGLNGGLFQELFKLVKINQIPYQFVPVEKLNRINSGNHQGVIGIISPVTYQKIESIIPFLYEKGKVPFIIILDGITDVRNFGAIARTAECAGVDAIVIPVKGAAQITGDAIKTSAGALSHIPVCREMSLLNTVSFLKNSGLKIISASEKTNNSYTNINYEGPIAIIMGSEEKGVSSVLLEQSDAIAAIPINSEIKSLNVSVAAGILIYEALKHR